MKARCQNPSNPNFRTYGGRGIRVCAAWQTLAGFIKDMGPRPAGATIDRIDNNGHYEPANCRWATRFEQAQNRRDTQLLTRDGRTQSVHSWCVELGRQHRIRPSTLQSRVASGMTFEEAIAKPLERKYSRRYGYQDSRGAA
jgi:hypothetical protein